MASARIAAFVSRAAGVGVLVFLFSGVASAVPDEDAETGPPKSSICLAAPKGAPPKGERWFYRVERGTKRHCWYTRAENGNKTAERSPARPAEPAQVADKPTEPQKPVEILKVTEAPAPAPLQLSVANARAEASVSTATPPSPAQAPAATAMPAPPSAAERPKWNLADRWSNDGGAIPEPAPAVQEITRALRPRVAEASPPAATQPRVPPPKAEPIDEADDTSSQHFADITAAALAALGLVTIIVAIVVLRRKPEPDDLDTAGHASVNVRPRLHQFEGDENEEPAWRVPKLDIAQIPRPNPRISRGQKA